MASRLANRHIELNAELRKRTVQRLTRIWNSLPEYRDQTLQAWLSTAVPLVQAAQRAEVTITQAYLARALDRPVVGVDIENIVRNARNGATHEEVYARPFKEVWIALANGTPFDAAKAQGLARATSLAATDIQLAMTNTLTAVGGSEEVIWGYQRVADGAACEYCLLLDGAQFRTDDPMPIHPNCVTGDTEVWSAFAPSSSGPELAAFASAQAATRRWYSGEVIVIRTARGHKLTVTPNHPILTDRGWVAAGELREGDRIVSGGGLQREHGRVPNEQNVPTRIEDYFGSRRGGPLVSVPLPAEYFHGDVTHGNIDVVGIDGSLDAGALAALAQPVQHEPFARRIGHSLCLSCLSGLKSGLSGIGNAALRGMSSTGPRLAFGSGLGSSSNLSLLGGGSLLNTGLAQMAVNHAPVNSKISRQSENGLTGNVALDAAFNADTTGPSNPALSQLADQRRLTDADGGCSLFGRLTSQVEADGVFHLDRVGFSGHVYNLITRSGWYAGNGIVIHNCGCGVEPVVYTRGFDNRNNLETFNKSLTGTPKGVDITTHGEIGPVIGDPSHTVTQL